MAIVNINYDCGCGKHMKTVEEAVKHADGASHAINVSGSVRPSEHKVRKASLSVPRSPRPSSKKSAVAPLTIREEDAADFGSMRARLQRK